MKGDGIQSYTKSLQNNLASELRSDDLYLTAVARIQVAAVQDRTLSTSHLLYQLNLSGEKRLKPLICRSNFLYQLALV